jgi:hypothetical protein
MRLVIIPGGKTEDPTREQIASALDQVYEGSVGAVILMADGQGSQYIQVAGENQHIEFREGEKSPVLAADGISKEQCLDIFWDFANGGSKWKTGEHWYPLVILDKKNKVKTPNKENTRSALPHLESSQYISLIPPQKTARKTDFRKALIAVVLTFILICGLCLLSALLRYTFTPEQFNDGVADATFGLFWFSLGFIASAALHNTELLGVSWNKGFLFVLLGCLILILILAWYYTYLTMGWASFAFLSALLAGGTPVYLVIRLINFASEFEHDSVEVMGSHVNLETTIVDFYPLADAPIYPEYDVVSFVFLEKYLDQIVTPLNKMEKYRKAFKEKKLCIQVCYLPRNPKIHRVRMEILN